MTLPPKSVPPSVSAAQRVGLERAIEALYGREDFPLHAGVLHVTALVWDGRSHWTLKITPEGPHSEYDALALQLARARADVILISGQILRDEPDLSYAGWGPHAQALDAWRRERMGRDEPPEIWVLSSGRNLPFEHPLWRSSRCKLLLPSTSRRDALREALDTFDIDTLVLPDAASDAPGVLSRVVRLVAPAQTGRTLSLEIGPRTSAEGYDPSRPLVDELLLSRYCSAALAPARLAPAPFDWNELPRHFGGSRPEERHPADPEWLFSRWRRATSSPPRRP